MARVCLLACIAGLLLEVYGLAAEIKEENTGAVFVSQQTADMVLRRLRRHNSGLEEIIQKANLERECKEETCSFEEAREVFEDDDKTMAFWAVNVDGDQCKPQPCQNEGLCEDGNSAYVCYCKPNYSGKNCEIEVNKQCMVNNGGCSHFCVMRAERPVCQCAVGYRLGPDKIKCEPTEQFSCGRVNISSSSATRSLTPRSSNTAHFLERDFNSSYTLEEYFYDEDITQFYDNLDNHTKDTGPFSIAAASVPKSRLARSDSSSSVNAAEASSVTETEGKPLPSWAFFPTISTITAKENTDERIVGGNDAIPGEIPWQVTLMFRGTVLQRAKPFCGGSLLSELWVMTAAHCLLDVHIPEEGYFVRVGEHDTSRDEGPERDHEVAEQHNHFMYDAQKSQYNHDIALLKLASPVELSKQRRPICLGPKDFIETILRDSSSSLVSGWGKLKFDGRQPTTLKKLEVPHVDRADCKQSSRDHITRYMFCAGFASEKKDSCQGDSGGPHATNYKGTWFLTGIVSWGEFCAAEGKYGVYTRVSRYYAWIKKTTGILIEN